MLPDAAQHAVAEAVCAVTPFEFPDEVNDKADFGDTVSTDATDEDNGVDGGTVSDDAKPDGTPTSQPSGTPARP